FRFGGLFGARDDGNGLDFMRARSYSPAQGRFIQPDPIGLVGGTNFYTYAENNPVSLIDPSGLQKVPPGWGYGNWGSGLQSRGPPRAFYAQEAGKEALAEYAERRAAQEAGRRAAATAARAATAAAVDVVASAAVGAIIGAVVGVVLGEGLDYFFPGVLIIGGFGVCVSTGGLLGFVTATHSYGCAFPHLNLGHF